MLSIIELPISESVLKGMIVPQPLSYEQFILSSDYTVTNGYMPLSNFNSENLIGTSKTTISGTEFTIEPGSYKISVTCNQG